MTTAATIASITRVVGKGSASPHKSLTLTNYAQKGSKLDFLSLSKKSSISSIV
jgi:hypothetical protein